MEANLVPFPVPVPVGGQTTQNVGGSAKNITNVAENALKRIGETEGKQRGIHDISFNDAKDFLKKIGLGIGFAAGGALTLATTPFFLPVAITGLALSLAFHRSVPTGTGKTSDELPDERISDTANYIGSLGGVLIMETCYNELKEMKDVAKLVKDLGIPPKSAKEALELAKVEGITPREFLNRALERNRAVEENP